MADRDPRAALLVVDVQPDFLPGGALPVAGGDAVLEPIARLMSAGRFGLVAATQDWHPPAHASFASRHGRRPFETIELHGQPQTLWPDHCVQGSDGARLHPDLPWDRAAVVVRKGADPDVDSYSGLRDNWNAAGERPPTGLAGYLRERGIEDLWVVGLARDVCVKWTAEDAADAGFRVRMVWDLTRPVDAASNPRVRRELEAKGVEIVTSHALGGA